MEQVVDIFIILALLTVTYVQLVLLLIGLRKVLSEGKKVLYCAVLCSQTATALVEWTIPETVDVGFLYFSCIINK